MSGQFHFSLRRLFALVTLLCVAACLVTVISTWRVISIPGVFATIALGGVIGCGAGLVTGRPIAGSLYGAAVALATVGLLWEITTFGR